MTAGTHSQLANFVWPNCNLLCGPRKWNEHPKAILSLAFLCRFDFLLEPTEAKAPTEKPETLTAFPSNAMVDPIV
jgi:hypothetical protein